MLSVSTLLLPTFIRRNNDFAFSPKPIAMKYICLGYYDRSKHEAMTEAEKQAMFDTCFT